MPAIPIITECHRMSNAQIVPHEQAIMSNTYSTTLQKSTTKYVLDLYHATKSATNRSLAVPAPLNVLCVSIDIGVFCYLLYKRKMPTGQRPGAVTSLGQQLKVRVLTNPKP